MDNEAEENPNENLDDSMADFNPPASSTIIEGQGPLTTQEEQEDTPPPRTSATPSEDTERPPVPSGEPVRPLSPSEKPERPLSSSEEPERPLSTSQDTELPLSSSLVPDKIFSETKDILNNLVKVVVQQRHSLLLCGYHIQALEQQLMGSCYTSLWYCLRNFLIHNEELQTCWFMSYYDALQSYGEYEVVLKDTPDKIVRVNEVPHPVTHSDLVDFASDSAHALYSGGLTSQAIRFLGAKISKKMGDLRDITKADYLPYQAWQLLCAQQLENFENLEKNCFDIGSAIGFMKTEMN